MNLFGFYPFQPNLFGFYPYYSIFLSTNATPESESDFLSSALSGESVFLLSLVLSLFCHKIGKWFH